MSPILPLWLLLFLAVGALIMSRWSYRPRRGSGDRATRLLSLLRFGTFLLIVLVLANIQLLRTSSFSKAPLIKVFLDNSISAGYHQSVSRESLLDGYDELLTTVSALTSDNPAEPAVEVYSFGERVTPQKGNPSELSLDEAATDLAAVLASAREVGGEVELSSVIIVSDGQTTVGADPESAVAKMKVPIYTVGIGEPLRMVDVRVGAVNVPTVVIRGEMVTAEATIESFGEVGQRVHVSLEKGSTLLGTRVVRPAGGGTSQTVRFQFEADQVGDARYAIRVSSVQDEINIENNRSSFSITTLKDRFRVAMITGAPSFNTRFLKLALSGEPRLTVDHFTQKSVDWEPSIAEFWRRTYDLIILDNFPTMKTPQRWAMDLAGKVSRGDPAISFIAGDGLAAEKLEDYLPLLGLQSFGDETEVKASLPIESLASDSDPVRSVDLTWSQFPPLSPTVFVEPGVETMTTNAQLMIQPPVPLMISGEIPNLRKGNSAVRRAVFTSADLWHLYFRGRGAEANVAIRDYWTELFRWLVAMSGDKDRYFRLTKGTFQRGEEVIVEGSLSGPKQREVLEGVWWRIAHPEGEETVVRLKSEDEEASWQGSFVAAEPGRYRYWILVGEETESGKEPDGEFFVEQALLELSNVHLNEESLRSLSESTGGHYVPWSDRRDLAELLSVERKQGSLVQTIHLSHWWPLVVLMLIILSSEWAYRRSRGLQ